MPDTLTWEEAQTDTASAPTSDTLTFEEAQRQTAPERLPSEGWYPDVAKQLGVAGTRIISSLASDVGSAMEGFYRSPAGKIAAGIAHLPIPTEKMADIGKTMADYWRERSKETEAYAQEIPGPKWIGTLAKAGGLMTPYVLAPELAPLTIGGLSYGSAYDQAKESYKAKGDSDEEAAKKAQLPAAASGLLSAGIWALTGPASRYLKPADQFAQPAFKSAITGYLTHVGVPSAAAVADTIQQETIAAATYNPDLTAKEILGHAAINGLAMMGLAGLFGVPALAHEAHSAYSHKRILEAANATIEQAQERGRVPGLREAAPDLWPGFYGEQTAERMFGRPRETFTPYPPVEPIPAPIPVTQTDPALELERRQHAIQIRGPTPLPVAQAPQVRPEMGGQIRQPQEPPIPQAQEAPGAPVLAPTVTETTLPVPPEELPKTPTVTGMRPAIRLVGGKVAVGDAGMTHPDIIKRDKIKAEEIDQRGFVNEAGQFLDREQTAAQTGLPTEKEEGRQHSTDLPESRATHWAVTVDGEPYGIFKREAQAHMVASGLSGKVEVKPVDLSVLEKELPPQNIVSLPAPASQTIPAGELPRSVSGKEIAVKPTLMQFKQIDVEATGENKAEQLSGKWDPYKAGLLLLWEPLEPKKYGLTGEQKYVIANGHHRLAHGRRQAIEPPYQAQVLREADGYSASDARRIAAEANIADGKGTIYDQVKWLRNSPATRNADEEMAARGRTGPRGRQAAAIAFDASDDLYAAFIAEKISPEQAAAIALAAPKFEPLQSVGLKAALRGKPADEAGLQVTIAKNRAQQRVVAGEQGDLFAFDESFNKEMDRVAAAAAAEIRALSQQRASVSGTARRPELAAKLGVAAKDPAALAKRLVEIDQRIDELRRHPERAVETPTPAAKPFFTEAEQKRVDELKTALRKKLGQLSIGVDPEFITLGGELALHYIRTGARRFNEYATHMLSDLGDRAKAYLLSWYNNARLQLTDIAHELDNEPAAQAAFNQRFGIATAERPTLPGSVGGIGVVGRRPSLRVAREELIPRPQQHVGPERYAARSGFRLDDEQVRGINLILDRFGGAPKGSAFLLADGPGFGKTAQSLAVADHYIESGLGSRILIITQNKTIAETRFRGDAERMGIDSNRFVITTYTGLSKLPSRDWDLIIFDESHGLKNGDAQKSMAAARLTSKHKLFATATPMDRPHGAAYFLSEITAEDYLAVAKKLGYTFQSRQDPITQQIIEVATPLPGFNWQKIWQNIIAYRDAAIAGGALIRREYPFFGKVGAVNLPMDFAGKMEHERIAKHYDRLIEIARTPTAKRNYAGQKTLTLSRWSEQQKINEAVHMAVDHVKSGGQAIIVAETDKRQKFPQPIAGAVKEIDERGRDAWYVDGAITKMTKLLADAGIAEVADIHDPTSNKIVNEVRKFQDGSAKVALATPQSGGTGIDLDDTKGNAPRLMIVLSKNFAGDAFEQLIGRISRKNTASPAEARFLNLNDSYADNRRNDVLHKKVRTLKAIQGGEELDIAAGLQTPTGQKPPAAPLELAAPESVEQQKARLAQEEETRKKKEQSAQTAAQAAKPLTGTTGDLGQGELLGGPQDLFAPPAPKPSPAAESIHDLLSAVVGPPLSETQIREHLRSQYGIAEDAPVRFVNEPESRREAQIVFDKRGPGAKVSYIEFNTAKIRSVADIDRLLQHELAHAASEGRGLDEAVKTLTDNEAIEIINHMQRLGYDPGGAGIGDEYHARAAELLAEMWRGRAWWEKLVGHILRIANDLGFKMTRLGAESAAVRALNQSFRDIAKQRGIEIPKETGNLAKEGVPISRFSLEPPDKEPPTGPPPIPEALQRRAPTKVFGHTIGDWHVVQAVDPAIETVRTVWFDSTQPVSVAMTEKMDRLLVELADPRTGAARSAQVVESVPGGRMGPSLLLVELHRYALKLAAAGDPLPWKFAVENHGVLDVMGALGGGPTAIGQMLRGLREGSDIGRLLGDLLGIAKMRMAAAGKSSNIREDVINEMADILKQAGPDFENLERLIGETKLPDGAKLIDKLLQGPITPDGMLEDIRRQQAVERALERERKLISGEADRVAQGYLQRLEQESSGAEWLKPEKPWTEREAIRREIKGVIAGALRVEAPIPVTAEAQMDFKRPIAELLIRKGVESQRAWNLADEILKKRETDWANARTRATEKAAQSGNLRSLFEAIKSVPYRMQKDPAWRVETARNWFMQNGLSREQADAVAKLFDKGQAFEKALQTASEKLARQFLESHGVAPKTIDDVVQAVRRGITDPDREWSADVANLRKGSWVDISREQHQKLAELELKLSAPGIYPPQQVDLVEQMHRILRNSGPHSGVFQRWLGEKHATALLDGPRTALLHVFQPIVSLFVRDMPVAAIFHARDFPAMLQMSLDALMRWEPNFTEAWQKDAYPMWAHRRGMDHKELLRQWEKGKQEWKDGKFYGPIRMLWSSGHFVTRFLQSANQAGAAVHQAWKMSMYDTMVMRDAGLKTREIAELADRLHEYKRNALEEGVESGLTRRAASLRADFVSAEMLEHWVANRTVDPSAAKDAMLAKELDMYSIVGQRAPGIGPMDEGFLSKPFNVLMDMISKERRKGGWHSIGGIIGTGFFNIPFRVARFQLNYSGYALFRYGLHRYVFDTKFARERGWQNPWKQTYANELQAKVRLQEAILGTGLMALVYAWMLKNGTTADDDRKKDGFWFYATGRGPRNKVLADALAKEGFPRYSIVFGYGKTGKPNSIPLTRIGGALFPVFAAAMIHDDMMWHEKELRATGRKEDNPISTELGLAIGTYAEGLATTGVFQSWAHLAQLAEGGRGFERALAEIASSTVSAIALPSKQLLASIDEMIFGVRDRSSIQAVVASNFAIPGAPWLHRGLNRFGDPIYDQSWYGKFARLNLPAFKVADDPVNQKVYQLLLDKGAAPPALLRSHVEDTYGPLSESQWPQYVRASGQSLKQRILQNADSLSQMPPEAVKHFMNQQGQVANEQAAQEMELRRQKPGRGVAAVGGGGLAVPSLVGRGGELPTVRGLISGRAGELYGAGAGALPATRGLAGTVARRIALPIGRVPGLPARRGALPATRAARAVRLVRGKLRPRRLRVRLPRWRRIGLRRRKVALV